MKRLIWIISLSMVTTLGVSQNNDSLKGPLTKNHKLWKLKSSSKSDLVSYTQPIVKQGPAAKNRFSLWKRKEKRTTTLPVSRNITRNNLKGPQAKNYKPGSNKTSKLIVNR